MPSRSAALSATLQEAGSFEVGSVAANGDCFYACIEKLLCRPRLSPRAGDDSDGGIGCGSTAETAEAVFDAGALRDLVADSITEERLELFRMYAAAGVEDFVWLNHRRAPQTLEEVRSSHKKSTRRTNSATPRWYLAALRGDLDCLHLCAPSASNK